MGLLYVLSNCKRDNSTPTAFSKTSYPLALGNWWQYQSTAIGFDPDTFVLRVDSIVTDGPNMKYICNYVSKGAIISAGYFLQSDTSMSFIQPYGYFTSFPNFHLKFPASTGQYWAGSFPGDSIIVNGVASSHTAYGHTYGPCYYLGEAYNLPHNSKVESMILTPKIGLIYQSINFNSDTAGIQIKQQVNLIDYHIQ